jgi:hypothetical protein
MRSVRSSSIAPGRPEGAVYLVLDDFGPHGQAYREADPRADNEQYILHNLLTGQYSKPQSIVAFNVAEGWCRDVTLEVSRKVMARTLERGLTLPDTTRAMVERAIGADVPAELRMA